MQELISLIKMFLFRIKRSQSSNGKQAGCSQIHGKSQIWVHGLGEQSEDETRGQLTQDQLLF